MFFIVDDEIPLRFDAKADELLRLRERFAWLRGRNFEMM